MELRVAPYDAPGEGAQLQIRHGEAVGYGVVVGFVVFTGDEEGEVVEGDPPPAGGGTTPRSV